MDDKARCADLVAQAWARRRAQLAGWMEHGTTDEDLDDDASPEARAHFEAEGDFQDYGLCWEYVAPETYDDQAEGFFRFLISTGGPGHEIRFFASPMPGRKGQGCPRAWSLYRAEFWLLDWFDGAPEDVTQDEVARWLWDYLQECESVQAAFDAAEG